MKKSLTVIIALMLGLALLVPSAIAEDTTGTTGTSDTTTSDETTEPEEELPSLEGLIPTSNSTHPFIDVVKGAWYMEGLDFCYTNGIVNGAGNSYTFDPKGELTRASFAVMLARALGVTDFSEYTSETFTDCVYKENSWYARQVEWAVAKGYMNGISDNKFAPTGILTREQFATVIMRFMVNEGYAVEVPEGILDAYTDKADVARWATEGMEYAVAAGLMTSTSTEKLAASPKMSVTRNQAVKLFMSFLRDYYYKDCEHDFTEADCTTGATCTLCGVVSSYPAGHYCPELNCIMGSDCVICGEYIPFDEGYHDFCERDCTTDEKCTVCLTVRRPAFGHKSSKATCTENGVCSVCGEVTAKAMGHNFSEATCYEKATCSRCKTTKGDILPHKYVKGYCEYCGYSPFDEMTYNLTVDGDLYGSISAEGEVFDAIIIYDKETDEIYFTLIHTYASGDYDVVQIDVNREGSSSNFAYAYYTGDEEAFYGYGGFSPARFSDSFKVTFTSYNGLAEDVQAAKNNTTALGHLLMTMCSQMMKDTYDLNLHDLGFTNY